MSVVVPGYLLMAGGLPLTQWTAAAAMFSGIVLVLLLVCVALLFAIADAPHRCVSRAGGGIGRGHRRSLRGRMNGDVWRHA